MAQNQNLEPADQQTTRPFLVVRGRETTGQKKPTNYLETYMHAVKGYVGTGIFAMGAAYANSGLLLGPLLMLLIALLSLHCQHILVKASLNVMETETVEVLPTFAETVQYTYEDSGSKFLKKHAKKMGILTDTFLVVAEYGFDVVYFIFIAEHFRQVTEQYGWNPDYRIILAIVFIPMWLLTFVGNLKFLTPVSMSANIIMWVGILILWYFACRNMPSRDVVKVFVNRPQRLPLFFGTVLFAFAGISFIIPLRSEMKNPKSFTYPFGVLNVSMVTVAILYLFTGVFAFWKWGDESEGSAFLNMPQDEELSQVTKILIAIGVALTYVIHMYIPFEILYPRFHRRFGPFKFPTLVILIYKTLAALLTYAIANISSDLTAWISLVGALTQAVLTMILPASLDLVIRYGNLSWLILMKDIIIIVTGVFGGLTGTVLSINDIYKSLSPYKNETFIPV